LAEGETAHPINYHGCSHVNEEMRKKKSQGTPKTITERVFSSNITTPAVSLVAVLRGTPDQNKRQNLRHEEVPGMYKHEGTKKEQQHETD
jgi:hypothetical protein